MIRKRMIFLLLIPFVLSGLAVAQDETVVEFPALTGEYQIGRAAYHMIDESREEVFTNRTDDVRELMVTIYYPAEPGAGDDPAPYMEDDLRAAVPVSRFIPKLRWDLVVSHAYGDVPVASSETVYPVLLFSPGAVLNPVFYTAMVEEVASHGYIVATLAHPYTIEPVMLPDGAVYMNYQGGIRLLENQDPTGSGEPGVLEEIGDVWVQDALFVLDQLALLNDDDPLLGGHMDLERLGMFGHSFGGATSFEAAYRDQRVQAAINMDGLIFSGAANNGFTQPFMMVFSDNTIYRFPPEAVQLALAKVETICAQSEAGYVMRLMESDHYTYSDMPLLLPLSDDGRGMGLRNPEDVDAPRAHEVITTYIVAFFDKHVKGDDVPLLEGPSEDYPDVAFEICGS